MTRILDGTLPFAFAISLSLALAPGAVAGPEDAPHGDVCVPVVLEPPAGPAGTAARPETVSREEEAVRRVAERYATRLRELLELAGRTRGMEHAAVQQRIEALKQQQAADELEARRMVALETRDEERLRQLEEISERPAAPAAPPPAPREHRPIPERRTSGGGR